MLSELLHYIWLYKKQTKKQQNLCETINFNKSSFLTKGEQCIVSKNLTPVNFNVDLTHA